METKKDRFDIIETKVDRYDLLEAEEEKLDLLTLSRVVKLFLASEDQVPIKELVGQYEDMNQDACSMAEEELASKLVHAELVTKAGDTGCNSILVPTKKMKQLMKKVKNYCGDDVDQSDNLAVNCQDEMSTHRPWFKSIPSLKISKEIRASKVSQVIVQDVTKPEEILFQLEGREYSEALDYLMREMMIFYNSTERNEYSIPARFEIRSPFYVAARDTDGVFNRALFLDKEKDKIKVQFIDYGNNGRVRREDLFFLKDQFTLLPAQALLGSITDLKEYGELPPEALAEFDSLKNLSASFLCSFLEEEPFWPIGPVPMQIVDADSGRGLREILSKYCQE